MLKKIYSLKRGILALTICLMTYIPQAFGSSDDSCAKGTTIVSDLLGSGFGMAAGALSEEHLGPIMNWCSVGSSAIGMITRCSMNEPAALGALLSVASIGLMIGAAVDENDHISSILSFAGGAASALATACDSYSKQKQFKKTRRERDDAMLTAAIMTTVAARTIVDNEELQQQVNATPNRVLGGWFDASAYVEWWEKK